MSQSFMCVQEPAAVIFVTGADAGRFLQGQFSNDLRNSTGHCVYGLWLDARGKIQGDGFVLGLEPNRFLIVSYRTPAEQLIAKLDRFIISDDVTLEPAFAPMSLLTLIGVEAVEEWLNGGQHVPESGDFHYKENLWVWHGRHGSSVAIDILAELPVIQKHVNWLGEKNVAHGTPNDLHRMCSQKLIPLIPCDVGEAETPADAGLEADAVSFKKGCFIGQEVVAKQRLTDRSAKVLALFRSIESLESLTSMALTSEGQVIGEVRSIHKSDTGSLVLALIKRKYAENCAESIMTDTNNRELRLQLVQIKNSDPQ